MSLALLDYIVQSLRTERKTPSGAAWSGEILSLHSGLSQKAIENIEYGKKKILTEEEILSLANSFELSPLERREFFRACAPEQESGANGISLIRDKIIPTAAKNAHPWIVLDYFFNISAVNQFLTSLFQLPLRATFEQFKAKKAIPNILVIAADRYHTLPPVEKETFLFFINANIVYFRAISMRYRKTKQYQDLMKLLFSDPEFTIIASSQERNISREKKEYGFLIQQGQGLNSELRNKSFSRKKEKSFLSPIFLPTQ